MIQRSPVVRVKSDSDQAKSSLIVIQQSPVVRVKSDSDAAKFGGESRDSVKSGSVSQVR